MKTDFNLKGFQNTRILRFAELGGHGRARRPKPIDSGRLGTGGEGGL